MCQKMRFQCCYCLKLKLSKAKTYREVKSFVLKSKSCNNMSASEIQELGGSELGTKDYWDKSYDTEIENYKSHGDVGEVWFDEDSQIRVINWMLKNDIPESSQIIDLGSGNGMMLVELYREGYKHLTGVDYSDNAIELAKQIAADQDMEIIYRTLDLLNADDIKQTFGDNKFDIVHDKGTYDAITLHPGNPADKLTKYIANLHNLTSDNGLLILSSCNWTENELKKSLDGRFELYETIPTPTFKFGGSVGSVVTQTVFKKFCP